MSSEFVTTRRMEFADTDLAGIVHFSRYTVFMETAEHEFLRSIGTDIHVKRDGDIVSWPRVSISCDYVQPSYYGEELEIGVTVLRRGEKSVTYGFDFRRGDDEIARGKTTAVFCVCNPGEKLRSLAIPADIAERLDAIAVTE
ncbi:acyl-CoA thioesterase [Candidatus Poribacteria bacterium]|jgi:acyl-CoA thioester hydrolase|nr:acyl-CoA thioesterase [Candidatus Poribacteria bacterium]MBT5534565.1 acyl-CoA thioesterase [Candidatus Poribacteria bacterium]MBT5714328.1 acyl-CoA thioesterase [Candidatus Poribacteria bacterium]MBT7804476.1 acyl-CoA thioesterase [Candidatus Poribacteria bacterium]